MIVVMFSALAFLVGQSDVVQISKGWCSPNIANVSGPVTVNCIGVDPRAVRRLNQELRAAKLQRSEALRIADEWAEKYHDLESRLSEAGEDSGLSRQAKEYIHQGDFEKAESVLEKLLSKEEKQVAQTAENHYKLGLLYQLQFQRLKALLQYEQAYKYRPDNINYAFSYATLLIEQNRHTDAAPILQHTLQTARELAKADGSHKSDVADILNNLGSVYSFIGDTKEAEASFLEALEIRRLLAKADPSFQRDAAQTLNNLAILYRSIQRMKEADLNEEALEIRRRLAKADPSLEPDVAATLYNLATLYDDNHRFKDAEALDQEALDIARQLATANSAYLPDVGRYLDSLAQLYRTTQRIKEADDFYQEALRIRRQLAKDNPEAYLPEVAMTLNGLAALYAMTRRWTEAEATIKEAVDINRRVIKVSPVYQHNLAETLANLANAYSEDQRFTEAEAAYQEALSIYQKLAEANPVEDQPNVATALNNLAILYSQNERAQRGGDLLSASSGNSPPNGQSQPRRLSTRCGRKLK